MSINVTINGPDFWFQKYGFLNETEFKVVCSKFLPNILPFGDLGIDNGTLHTAWIAPWGIFGVAIQAGLALEGYTGVAATSGQSIQQLLNQALSIGVQEQQMSGLVIAGCFQVAINATSGSQQVTNVFGVENSGGTAHGAGLAVQAAWKAATTGPMSYLPSEYVLANFTSTDIGSLSGAIDVISDTTAGSSGSAISTNAACALVKWNGGTRSKSSRGRTYFGPMQEGFINSDGRTITSTQLALFNTCFTNFRASLSTAGYPLVVLSRKLSTATLITSSGVESVIATQRRRIRG